MRELVAALVIVLFFASAICFGSEPQFTVENKMPAFMVTNRVPAATATDPRGIWSPVWDGQQWQPRWVKEGVSQKALPKANQSSGESITGSTVGTTAQTRTAMPSSSTLIRNSGVVYTLTNVGFAGQFGGTVDNCSASG